MRHHHRVASSCLAALTLVLTACSSGLSSSAGAGPSKSAGSGALPSASTRFVNYLTTLAPPQFTPRPGRYKIALLDASTVLPQQKSLEVGVQDAAKKFNVDLTAYDAGGFQNLSKQVNQLDTAIAQKPDAILLLPASPVALDSGIARARSAGIKIIPMLIPPPSGNYDYAAADDLPFDAATSVNALAARTGGKGSIFALIGGAGSTVAQLFKQGMTDQLQKYPGLKVVFSKELSGYSQADAQSATESALTAQPHVDGIITNDTILGLGAARALTTKGLRNVPIAGIGPGDRTGIDALKSGQIAVGATPPFYAAGFTSVQWALYLLGGGQPATKTVRIPPMVLTKDNIGAAISSRALFDVLAPPAVGCGPGQAGKC